MKNEQLVELLTKQAGAKKDGSTLLLPDGQLSLYVSFPGETLVVSRITRVELHDPFLRLETSKGERFVVAVEDVRALKLEPESAGGPRDRSAGFSRT